MRNQSILGLMLSSSVALSTLAGCAVPTPAGAGAGQQLATPSTRLPAGSGSSGPAAKPATQTGQNAGLVTPGSATAQALNTRQLIEQATAGTTDALADEKEMDDYDRLADDAGYSILQLTNATPVTSRPLPGTGDVVNLPAPIKPMPRPGDVVNQPAPIKPPMMGERPAQPPAFRCRPDAIKPLPGDVSAQPGTISAVPTRLELAQENRIGRGEPGAMPGAEPGGKPEKGGEPRCGGGIHLERVTQLKALAEAKRKEMTQQAKKLKLAEAANQKRKEREENAKKSVQARLGKLSNDREKMKGALGKADWVDNGDGTKTKTVEFDVNKTINGKSLVRKAKLVRTINADKQVVSMSAEFEQSLPGGLSRKSARTKVLQADGSYQVSFDSSVTLPNGFTHVVEWDKVIAVDGTVTGTGTHITLDADGNEVKKVSLTMSGRDAAPEAKLSGDGGKLQGSVKIDESGAPKVEAKDGETAVPVTVVTDDNGTISTGVTEEVTQASST